jgi:dihydrodipicolinate reductase
VVVAGALGRMGAEVVKAVRDAADCTLVGAIDTTPGKEGTDVGLELLVKFKLIHLRLRPARREGLYRIVRWFDRPGGEPRQDRR